MPKDAGVYVISLETVYKKRTINGFGEPEITIQNSCYEDISTNSENSCSYIFHNSYIFSIHNSGKCLLKIYMSCVAFWRCFQGHSRICRSFHFQKIYSTVGPLKRTTERFVFQNQQVTWYCKNEQKIFTWLWHDRLYSLDLIWQALLKKNINPVTLSL